MTSEKMKLLARLSVKRREEEERLRASMSPEELEAYLQGWAQRLSFSLSRAGEAEYGETNSIGSGVLKQL